jgi:hypothetical protein
MSRSIAWPVASIDRGLITCVYQPKPSNLHLTISPERNVK